MNDKDKYDAILKWLVTSVFAQAPNNTDADIDYNIKKQYPELNTPTSAWGLHRLLDQLIKDGNVRYQDRKIEDSGSIRTQRWYEATQNGVDYINNLIKKEKSDASKLKRLMDASMKVGAEDANKYLRSKMIENIEAMLDYMPYYGEFKLSDILFGYILIQMTSMVKYLQHIYLKTTKLMKLESF